MITDEPPFDLLRLSEDLLVRGELDRDTLLRIYVRRGVEDKITASLRTGSHEPIILIGESGAGKSTLIRFLLAANPDGVFQNARIVDLLRWQERSKEAIVSAISRDLSTDDILLLDNIDVFSHRYGQDLARQVIYAKRPRSRVVITARPNTFRAIFADTIHTYNVILLPTITASQFSEVVERLLRATGRRVNSASIQSLLERFPVDAASIRHLLGLFAKGFSAEQLERDLQPFEFSLLSPSRSEVAAATPTLALISEIRTIDAGLYRLLAAKPKDMQRLDPYVFERLVADLLDRRGYKVLVTPQSGDGGIDIFARRFDGVHDYLLGVQCKRFSLKRPIEVGLIRELLGSIDLAGASAGLLATTSVFRSGALELQEKLKHRLSLMDYLQLHAWIREAANLPSIATRRDEES